MSGADIFPFTTWTIETRHRKEKGGRK